MHESEFWRFSLTLYAQPGMAQACLELQDQAGVDVNVMFYLLFLATHGRQTNDADVARIEDIAGTWRNTVVVPLRELRRALKSAIGPFDLPITSSLRSEVKRIELAAERIQQETLERLVPLDSIGPGTIDHAGAARANLAVYCRRLGSLRGEQLEFVLSAFAHRSVAEDRP